jgi:bombesin-like receptor 3
MILNETIDSITIILNSSINEIPVINPGKSWAPILVPTFFAVLLLAGIFGNVIICYIILRHKYMQITPNLYIMNLAFGNLLLLIFSAPFTAISYLLDTYPFGLLMCKIDQTSQNLTLGVTIFTLVALSYDRCISIRDP